MKALVLEILYVSSHALLLSVVIAIGIRLASETKEVPGDGNLIALLLFSVAIVAVVRQVQP